MKYLAVKDYDHFQHYSKRTPPWIKFYFSVLEDYGFLQLAEVTQRHLTMLWLVASRYDGFLPDDRKYLATAIKARGRVDWPALISAGFLIEVDQATRDAALAEREQDDSTDASNALAEREHDASPHARPRARESQRERQSQSQKQSSQLPDSSPSRRASDSESGRGTSPARALARWIERFYGTAKGRRRDAVRKQLGMLWNGESVKLYGTPVTPKDRAHLERKAAEMLEPEFACDNDDRAIVILLQKLTDQERDANGKFPSENAAIAAKEEEQLADEHESARKAAIAEWRVSHVTELLQLEHDLRSTVTTPKTDIGYRAELALRVNAVIVERMGFPDFDTWRAQRRAS